MRLHQRGVDVDHIEPRLRARSPRPGAGRGAGGFDLPNTPPGGLQGPPQRRSRRHRTEQPRLTRQRGDVTNPLTAISDHHRRIRRHPAPPMTPITRPDPHHRQRQRRRQPDPVGQISQQPSPGMHRQTLPPTSELEPRPGACTLHHASAFLGVSQNRVTNPILPHQKGTPRSQPPPHNPLLKYLG